MTEKHIALVTGGAQGIGYACAEAIGEDGAQIVLADINGEEVRNAASRLGGGAIAMQCDMSKTDEIDQLFEKIESEVGTVSVLVNNAGIAQPCDFLETTIEQFREVIDLNLIGTFYALQRAAKSMVKQGVKGSIVNLSLIHI